MESLSDCMFCKQGFVLWNCLLKGFQTNDCFESRLGICDNGLEIVQ